MIIVAQDKSLINMDKISYIYESNNSDGINAPTLFNLMAEDRECFYIIGTYTSSKEAQKQVDRIRQGIEEGWNICAID